MGIVWQCSFGDVRYPSNNEGNPVGRTSTHWQVSDYFQNDYGANFIPGVGGSGGESLVKENQNVYTSLGSGGNQPTGDDTIFAAANNASGGGGKGFRHWRGNGANGDNDCGGGLRIEPPSALGEFWIRYYVRYQFGFTFCQPPAAGATAPGYVKEFRNNSANGCVFGFYGGAVGLHDTVAGDVSSSKTWQSLMGGMTGDGLWHCIEYHWQNGNNSHIEIWVDDVQVLDTIINTSTDTTASIAWGDNQNAVGDANGVVVNNGGTPTDWYTDYDDIAISDSGRIGPLSGGAGQTIIKNRKTRWKYSPFRK